MHALSARAWMLTTLSPIPRLPPLCSHPRARPTANAITKRTNRQNRRGNRIASGTSLQEIARQFGGRHHIIVLHSINKIEQMCRTDEALNRTITRLVDTVVARTLC